MAHVRKTAIPAIGDTRVETQKLCLLCHVVSEEFIPPLHTQEPKNATSCNHSHSSNVCAGGRGGGRAGTAVPAASVKLISQYKHLKNSNTIYTPCSINTWQPESQQKGLCYGSVWVFHKDGPMDHPRVQEH